MSSLAVPDTAGDGQPMMGDDLIKPIRENIRRGRDHKKQFEGNWALNLAFAAGDHWSLWDNQQRVLRRIQDTDAAYENRELHTADVVTEYRMTALGELGADNDRPQLLLRRDDEASEQYETQLNRAVGYGWNYEWRANRVLSEVDQYLIDLGTAAVRCRFDPTVGEIKADNVPHLDGKPILNQEAAVQAVSAAAEGGQTLEFKPIKAGKITWEAISALSLITPPGVTHEDKFPWECIVRPAYLPDVKARYGELAADLKEDGDIRSDLGLTATGADAERGTRGSRDDRLRDHVWLYSYYDRPSSKYPKGRHITLGGGKMKLLEYNEQLDYVAPDGSYRSGISYFHWWRVTGRFWSRSLMDVMRGPQYGINKRKTQINEIIDKSMPYVIVEKDSKATQRQGTPMEMIEVGREERQPLPSSGVAPGTWMQNDVESLREDLEHATGIRGPRLGENPPGVTTYAQLALMNENEQTKRNTIRDDRRASIGVLVEDSIYDMRLYWGEDKQTALAGEDGKVEAEIFNATKIPTFFIVELAQGSPKPRTQGAKLQLITDIWQASIAAAQPLPLSWLKDSMEAGEPLDLPSQGGENPVEKADLENHLMSETRQVMPIAYYDPHQLHLPRHRAAQDDAMFTGDTELWQVLEQHCNLHMNAAMAQQQAVMDQQAQTQALGQTVQQNQLPQAAGQPGGQ